MDRRTKTALAKLKQAEGRQAVTTLVQRTASDVLRDFPALHPSKAYLMSMFNTVGQGSASELLFKLGDWLNENNVTAC